MAKGRFDSVGPIIARPAHVRRPDSPGAGPTQGARPDPLTVVLRGAGGVQRPQALAAALNRAGGGRLARTGASLLQLQRQYGNRYVQAVIRQARANEAVPRVKTDGKQPTAPGVAGDEVDGSMHDRIEACRSGGHRLDPKVSAQLGEALGADLSRVKVHASQEADSLSRSLNAEAFAIGSDIFFRANRYNPSTSDGRHLLAHELTHVVQRGASVRPVSRLRLAPANDAYERQADRVAGAVVGGMRAPSSSHLGRDQRVQSADALQGPAGRYLTGPWGSPSIQRKVYLGKKRLEQVPGGKDEGAGDRSVSNMIKDQPSRYFEDEDELYEYARGETETIGYVEKKGAKEAPAWIRIKENELLVLGEHHEKKGKTFIVLPDVATAVGTDRWRYERAEYPPWMSQAFTQSTSSSTLSSTLSSTSSSTSSAQPLWSGKGWEYVTEGFEKAKGHEGEDLLPKLWRGLAAFDFEKELDKELVKTTSYTEQPQVAIAEFDDPTEWLVFQLAIFTASRADAERDFPALYEVYQEHKDTLEPVLSTELNRRMDWGKKAGWQEVKESVQALQSAVEDSVKETMTAAPSYKTFKKGWRQPKSKKKDYDNSSMVEADRARDLGFYQHILQAREDKILLFGFGELHGERLKTLLKEAKGIKYMTMDKLLDGQRKKYPQ